MKINVYPFKIVKKLIASNKLPTKNWISIRDIGYDYLYDELNDHVENLLIIHFDDVTESNIRTNTIHPVYKKLIGERKFVLFDNNMARKIIDFSTEVYKKHEDLNIHCWAGKSRSQAVGYVLNQYFNLYLENNKKDFLFNLNNSLNTFRGNFDVIRVMNEELYKNEYICT